MPKFRENRELVLHAYQSNFISDEEFVLLYDINSSKNCDIPYWKYDSFDLDKMTDDECKAEFRFLKNDIYALTDILQLPNEIVCYNGTKTTSTEGLCMLLKRFAYPCRHVDMCPKFGRSIPELCLISNNVMEFIYTRWNHLLHTFIQPWLSPANLARFSAAIHNKGAALNNCWGFVDGTVRPVSRPGKDQRILYNGHKKVHSIKFQSVATPSGLVANLFGPVEGKRHDSSMLAESGLLNQLQQHSWSPNGNLLCIYGDPAYPLRPQLQAPFKGARITPIQNAWNKSMSSVRVSVEWIFGDIVNFFKFLDFKKNLKIQLSAVGKMYITCTLLQNARSCLYGSTTSMFFELDPPMLEEYFV